jgi:hypothetical protein
LTTSTKPEVAAAVSEPKNLATAVSEPENLATIAKLELTVRDFLCGRAIFRCPNDANGGRLLTPDVFSGTHRYALLFDMLAKSTYGAAFTRSSGFPWHM